MIGTGLAIGLGLASIGTEAATSLYGAKKASDASKTAAQQQVDASNKALDLQKSIYDDQVARTKPYVDAGTTSLNNLMSQYWGTPFNAQVSSAVAGGRSAVGLPPPPGTLGGMAPPQAPQGPLMRQPLGAPMGGAPAGPPMAAGPAGPGGPGGPPPQNGSGGGDMVPMVSADGSESAMVPANMVPQFLAKGGRVVSGPPPSPQLPQGTLGRMAVA